MLVLVLGNHTSQTRLDIVKALRDAGVQTGEPSNQYQDMDFRALNKRQVNWKNPEPRPFHIEEYDPLYLDREEKHDVWTLSDPRMLFYTKSFLALVRSHRNKSRIIIAEDDFEEIVSGIANRHNMQPDEARKIASRHKAALDKWVASTRRRCVTVDKMDEEALDTVLKYLGMEQGDE